MEPVCLTAFIWGEGKEPCASANLRLIAHDSKPVLMASDITACQGLAAQLYADMKQGGLQTTIYPVWYSVSLDCIGLYPHISRSWVAMLATPTLISAEQEIHLLFPDLPKPSWVPLRCSQHVLLTMPTALPDKAGCGRGSFLAASAVTSLSDLLSRHCDAPLVCRGSWAPNSGGILAGDWAADKHTCRDVATGSNNVRYRDKLGNMYCHAGNWLWHCHLLQEIITSHTFTMWPYCTIGLFLWGFPLDPNGVTGIKEFDRKTKISWHCFSYFSSSETYMHHILTSHLIHLDILKHWSSQS